MAVQTKPQIVIPTEVEAIATANRWLHQEIGMALQVTTATQAPIVRLSSCMPRGFAPEPESPSFTENTSLNETTAAHQH